MCPPKIKCALSNLRSAPHKSRIRGERLRKRVERIRRNDKIGIWEIKRKIKNKGYTQRQITNDKGKIITDQEEILKEYERYYKDLLQTKKATTEKEREIEVKVEEAFTALKEEAEQRHEGEMITMADVRKGIKLLKWKKAPDRQGWRGEWLKTVERKWKEAYVNYSIRWSRK